MKLKQAFVLIMMVVCVLLGFLGAQRYEQSQYESLRTADAATSVEQQEDLRAAAREWARNLASQRGQDVLRAFAAGLTPLLLSDQQTAMSIAGSSLLRLHGVQGVAILRTDGKVLYASDAKLTVSEDGNEQSHWALQAREFASRNSYQPDVVEMALPINDAGKVLAVVWLAYDTRKITEPARPELLADASAQPPVAADNAAVSSTSTAASETSAASSPP
jgi:hypothetical protein